MFAANRKRKMENAKYAEFALSLVKRQRGEKYELKDIKITGSDVIVSWKNNKSISFSKLLKFCRNFVHANKKINQITCE